MDWDDLEIGLWGFARGRSCASLQWIVYCFCLHECMVTRRGGVSQERDVGEGGFGVLGEIPAFAGMTWMGAGMAV